MDTHTLPPDCNSLPIDCNSPPAWDWTSSPNSDQTDDATPAIDARLCEDCLEIKPLDQFRLRKHAGQARVHQCRACHNAYERYRRAVRATKRRRGAVGKYDRQLTRADTPQQVVAICGLMLNYFGGVQNLAVAIAETGSAIQRSRDLRAGVPYVFALWKMMKVAAAINDQQEDERLAGLDEEDIRRELVQGMREALAEDPLCAVTPLREAGWTVIAPA